MEWLFKRKDATHPINMNYSNNQRKQPGHESAPKPEPDAESGYSTTTTLSDRLKDFNGESIADHSSAVRRSPQGSECSSSGYSSASFRSNRSKDIGHDFNSQHPFKPESFRKIHEALLQSRQEDLHNRECLLHQLEDSLRQWEDSLRQQAVQQEAQWKMINGVGDEQHLKSGMTHSCGPERAGVTNLFETGSYQCCVQDHLTQDQDKTKTRVYRDRDKTKTFRVRDQVKTKTEGSRDRVKTKTSAALYI